MQCQFKRIQYSPECCFRLIAWNGKNSTSNCEQSSLTEFCGNWVDRRNEWGSLHIPVKTFLYFFKLLKQSIFCRICCLLAGLILAFFIEKLLPVMCCLFAFWKLQSQKIHELRGSRMARGCFHQLRRNLMLDGAKRPHCHSKTGYSQIQTSIQNRKFIVKPPKINTASHHFEIHPFWSDKSWKTHS